MAQRLAAMGCFEVQAMNRVMDYAWVPGADAVRVMTISKLAAFRLL